MEDRCYGCFGASFNDCENCEVMELDVNDMKIYTDLHTEELEDGEEEKVL